MGMAAYMVWCVVLRMERGGAVLGKWRVEARFRNVGGVAGRPWVQDVRALPRLALPMQLQLAEADAVKLDEICREHGLKLILIRSYGLVGYLRVSEDRVGWD